MPATVWTLAISWAFEKGARGGQKKTHGGRALRALPVFDLPFENGRVSNRLRGDVGDDAAPSAGTITESETASGEVCSRLGIVITVGEILGSESCQIGLARGLPTKAPQSQGCSRPQRQACRLSCCTASRRNDTVTKDASRVTCHKG
jgi:hypothetical protein